MSTVHSAPPALVPRVRERARDAAALMAFSLLSSLALALAFAALTLTARFLGGYL